jgi:hypothetical protein
MEKVNLLQCNPATLAKTHTTCLPMESLERLRDVWNSLYPAHRIPMTIHKKERLWAELRLRLQQQYKCSTEYCAVERLSGTNTKNADKAYFRPKKPEAWIKKPTQWQDSTTLTAVMEQYESAYPDFEFIGPTPIDFDSKEQGVLGRCIMEELCNLDLSELRSSGKLRIGIIFNLDPHDQPGSHWVCAFIDLNKMAAYYYDSYGYVPPKEIKQLLRRCKSQGCKEVIWNDIRHQKKGTECGTYCLYVLISMILGKSFKEVCGKKHLVDDDTINSIRDLLFATEIPSEKAIQAANSLF